MIQFLQFIEIALFLLIAYHVIKLSPLLESAAFINGQNIIPQTVEKITVLPIKTIHNKPTTHIKAQPKFHYIGMNLAH